MDLVEMLFNNAMNAEGGGGGGGDSSIATVTIYCMGGTIKSMIPTIDEEDGIVMASPLTVLQGGEGTFKVPLYTNGVYVDLAVKEGTTPQIMGDAVYENGGFIITGDCAIAVETD